MTDSLIPTTSVLSNNAGHALTMSSYDFLNNIINPARKDEDEPCVQNRHFLVKVEDEIDDLGDRKFFTHPQNQKPVSYYDLNLDQMTLVGMRESKAVRKKVLAQLKKLDQPAKQNLPDFSDPVAAARAWADALEQKRDAEAKLIEAQPKLEFVEKYVESTGLKTFREVAKYLNANEREFRAFLVDRGIMYQLNSSWVPYERHIKADRFAVKTGENNGYAFTQCKFTPKGVEWISQLWSERSN